MNDKQADKPEKSEDSGTLEVTIEKLVTGGDGLARHEGQAVFVPQTGAAGTYGSFSVNAQGHWSYKLDNSQAAIQQLGPSWHPSTSVRPRPPSWPTASSAWASWMSPNC